MRGGRFSKNKLVLATLAGWQKYRYYATFLFFLFAATAVLFFTRM